MQKWIVTVACPSTEKKPIIAEYFNRPAAKREFSTRFIPRVAVKTLAGKGKIPARMRGSQRYEQTHLRAVLKPVLFIAQDSNGYIGVPEPAQYEFKGAYEFGGGGNGVWRAGKGVGKL